MTFIKIHLLQFSFGNTDQFGPYFIKPPKFLINFQGILTLNIPQIHSRELQATNIDIFLFKITTLIQPLLGLIGAQELFSDAPGCILEWWMPSWSPYEAALVCGWLWTPSMLLLNLSSHIMGKLFAYPSD